MDKLINKRSSAYDYPSRYAGVPYFFDTAKNRDIYGLTSQINFNAPYLIHKIVEADTLDKLALVYYNNPTYWWIIAYFNKINDPFTNIVENYRTLKIPTISNISFEE